MSLLETLFLLHHVSKFTGNHYISFFILQAFVSWRSWGPHFQNQRTSLYRKSEPPDGFHFPATHHPIFGIAPNSLPDSYFSPLALEAWLPILLHPETIYDQFYSIDWERNDEKLTLLHQSPAGKVNSCPLQPHLTALRNDIKYGPFNTSGIKDLLQLTAVTALTVVASRPAWRSMTEISTVIRSGWSRPWLFASNPRRAASQEVKLPALLTVLLVHTVPFNTPLIWWSWESKGTVKDGKGLNETTIQEWRGEKTK